MDIIQIATNSLSTVGKTALGMLGIRTPPPVYNNRYIPPMSQENVPYANTYASYQTSAKNQLIALNYPDAHGLNEEQARARLISVQRHEQKKQDEIAAEQQHERDVQNRHAVANRMKAQNDAKIAQMSQWSARVSNLQENATMPMSEVVFQ